MSHPTAEASPRPADRTATDRRPTAGGRRGGMRRPARIAMAALLLGALALAIRASVLRDAYFITDDYMLASRAMENELTLDYLTRVHTGHLEPIGFGVMWLLAHFAPFSWLWACVFLLGCQAILFLMVWKMLTEIFGRRWLVLVPFAMFCFSALTVGAFTWLSAGIIWLPLMIATAGVIRYHVRYIRDGHRRDALLAVVWLLVGMASFEKIVLLLPFLVVFTLALEGSYRGTSRPTVSMLRRQLPIWIGYGVLSIAYVLLYVRGSSQDDASAAVAAPTVSEVAEYLYLSLGKTFIPGMFGGPWSWAAQPPYGLAHVDSARMFEWITWLLFVAVVAGSVFVRKQISLYWASLLLYVSLALAIVAVGRVPYMGTFFGLEARYLADAVIPLVVVVGCALMPLSGETDPFSVDGSRLLRGYGRQARLAAFAAVAVMVVLALNSISGYAEHSSVNPTKDFVQRMQASLEELPDDAEIVDRDLPDNVLTPLWGNYNKVSRFIAPLLPPDERQQIYTRRSYTNPYVMQNDGTFRQLTLGAQATQDSPPGWCWSNEGGTVTVPLTSRAYQWNWVVHLKYLATSQFIGLVAVDGEAEPVTFNAGSGEVWVSLLGEGQELTVTGLPLDAGLCISEVTVGTPSVSDAP